MLIAVSVSQFKKAHQPQQGKETQPLSSVAELYVEDVFLYSALKS